LLTKILVAGSFVLLFASSMALAESYCAVFPWGKECDFTSYEDCHRAVDGRGRCEFNSQEDKGPGNAAFCLTTPHYGTKCTFDDERTCRMAAVIENSKIVKRAECIKNPNR